MKSKPWWVIGHREADDLRPRGPPPLIAIPMTFDRPPVTGLKLVGHRYQGQR